MKPFQAPNKKPAGHAGFLLGAFYGVLLIGRNARSQQQPDIRQHLGQCRGKAGGIRTINHPMIVGE